MSTSTIHRRTCACSTKIRRRRFPTANSSSRTSAGQGPEYKLLDTGVFDDDRYFDVLVEYGKADPEDLVIRITAQNRGPNNEPLHIMPTLWFRNTWAWGPDAQPGGGVLGDGRQRHAA